MNNAEDKSPSIRIWLHFRIAYNILLNLAVFYLAKAAVDIQLPLISVRMIGLAKFILSA
jgi:hypothetical protein